MIFIFSLGINNDVKEIRTTIKIQYSVSITFMNIWINSENTMNNYHPYNTFLSFRFVCRLFLLIITVFSLTSCGSRKVIVNALDEKEANEILVFLSNKGIDAVKVKAETESGGGNKAVLWNISVESSQSNEAMAKLNQAGLPRRRGQNLLGIFSSSSLVPSGMQEKIRFQAGLAEQIASTIRKIDGILEADVNISYPEEDPLNPNAPKQKVTASVYVKHSGVLDDPNAHLMSRIKRLVASGVNNLDYDNVAVIGDRARYSENPLGGFQGSLGDDERPIVNVWSLSLAKDSLSRFRFLFFSFIVTLFILATLLGWVLWKVFPILKQVGFKEFKSIKPLSLESLLESLKPSEAKPETQEQKESDQPSKDEDTSAT